MDDTMLRPLILIVDDELLIRESLADALMECGYETLTAASGEEALEICQSHDLAAIVTDMYMGGTDGLVLLSALRERRARVPIVVMSGGQMELARKLGADATLSKPFRPRDLERLLERLLERMPVTAK